LTNGIQAVADSTGHEFREVLSSVDAMMKQFGINGETALKIIQDGFVAGADDSGQFLDMLKQYQGSFNDIGVSADELTAIIAQTRSGIFNEEGMAAIQMAGKNIRNMSKSTKESLAAIGISAD
jgi:phage-related minor tail protein